jgi:hypothetical protein
MTSPCRPWREGQERKWCGACWGFWRGTDGLPKLADPRAGPSPARTTPGLGSHREPACGMSRRGTVSPDHCVRPARYDVVVEQPDPNSWRWDGRFAATASRFLFGSEAVTMPRTGAPKGPVRKRFPAHRAVAMQGVEDRHAKPRERPPERSGTNGTCESWGSG